uniref:Uncharacterized protein n=1 Tax=Romanomermis culicivorax TaxID=13658 RepID=A0A915ID33_ROMCU
MKIDCCVIVAAKIVVVWVSRKKLFMYKGGDAMKIVGEGCDSTKIIEEGGNATVHQKTKLFCQTAREESDNQASGSLKQLNKLLVKGVGVFLSEEEDIKDNTILNQIVGNSLAPLLHIVNVQGKYKDIVSQSYEKPHYIPIQLKEITVLK